MKVENYLQCANIFFVPIVRQRVNFAVLIRRVNDALELDDQDAIAVALPPSVYPFVRQAIDHFPALRLVIASLDATHFREVFPVAPGDGLVEAIRIANEREIHLECIDRELAPGHLMGHQCEPSPNWPDDGFALQLGARRYLELISQKISQPPIRIEPVDTWREMAMVENLRRLQPQFRRVLCVCESIHAIHLMRLLAFPSEQFDLSDEGAVRPSFHVVNPSLEIHLHYLDDFPKIVQAYEEQRRAGLASKFNKSRAVLDAVRSLDESSGDVRLSVRQYEAFTRYLYNVLAANYRVSPRPEDVFEACRGCFNEAFAERVHRHLCGYFDEIQVERVGRWEDTHKPVYAIRQTITTKEIYVSRSCNPNPLTYHVEHIPRQLPKPRESANSFWHGWPPFEEFFNKMRTKVYGLAARATREPKRQRFRGSLEGGVDARSTLRSFWRDDPTLFVNAGGRRKTPSTSLTLEPIVWLLDLQERNDYSLVPWITGGGNEEEVYVEWLYYCSEKQPLYRSTDESLTVEFRRVNGYVSFCDAGSAVDALRLEFGPDFERRVPSQSDTKYCHLGVYPASIEDALDEGAPWWEILLISAIHYARQTVLCVVPEGLRLPVRVVAKAREEGKRVLCVRASQFESKEREKLAVNYLLQTPTYDPGEELNNPKFVQYRVQAYANIMKQFWVD
jgi:hypothetical protein